MVLCMIVFVAPRSTDECEEKDCIRWWGCKRIGSDLSGLFTRSSKQNQLRRLYDSFCVYSWESDAKCKYTGPTRRVEHIYVHLYSSFMKSEWPIKQTANLICDSHKQKQKRNVLPVSAEVNLILGQVKRRRHIYDTIIHLLTSHKHQAYYVREFVQTIRRSYM